MSLMGVAALPSDEFMGAVADFQARHRDAIHGPRLGLDTNLPHVSVVQCPFASDIDGQEVLASIASGGIGGDVPDLRPVRVAYYPPGWLFLEVFRSEWLVCAQGRALAATERFIDEAHIDRAKDLGAYTPLERSNYLRYGYRYVGEAFHPHVTLGRVEEHVNQSLVEELSESFGVEVGYHERPVDRLAFYRAGESGALVEVLAEVSVG